MYTVQSVEVRGLQGQFCRRSSWLLSSLVAYLIANSFTPLYHFWYGLLVHLFARLSNGINDSKVALQTVERCDGILSVLVERLTLNRAPYAVCSTHAAICRNCTTLSLTCQRCDSTQHPNLASMKQSIVVSMWSCRGEVQDLSKHSESFTRSGNRQRGHFDIGTKHTL